MIKAVKMSFINSPKKSDRNRKLQHRTRVGSRGLRKAMRHHLAWPAYQPALGRPLWWCSRSYSAASAAWIVFAAPAWVSIKSSRAGFTKKGYLARFAGDPCAPGGRAILNFIARVYRRARARVFALKFCFHGLNHGCPLSNQVNISHVSQYARHWPYFGAWALMPCAPVNVCAPVNSALQLKQGTGWPAGIVGND